MNYLGTKKTIYKNLNKNEKFKTDSLRYIRDTNIFNKTIFINPIPIAIIISKWVIT